MVPSTAAVKRLKTKRRSDFGIHLSKGLNYLKFEDIHGSSAQLHLLVDMDSKSASDPNTPEPNMVVSPKEISSPENMGANDAPALNLTKDINTQSAPPVGNGSGNQLRHPKPGRERNRQHLVLS
ncbi:hypothetical protein F66182_18746, partial [Fusarium sp. NRRL 66182]